MADGTVDLKLDQLRQLGILIPRGLSIDTLTSEDLYVLVRDVVQMILVGAQQSTGSSSGASEVAAARQAAVATIVNASESLRAARADLKSLPAKLPSSSKDRFSSCSTLCSIIGAAVPGMDGTPPDYSIFMYPNAGTTRELIGSLVVGLSEASDNIEAAAREAKAIKEASEATTGGRSGAQRSLTAIAQRSMMLLRRRIADSDVRPPQPSEAAKQPNNNDNDDATEAPLPRGFFVTPVPESKSVLKSAASGTLWATLSEQASLRRFLANQEEYRAKVPAQEVEAAAAAAAAKLKTQKRLERQRQQKQREADEHRRAALSVSVLFGNSLSPEAEGKQAKLLQQASSEAQDAERQAEEIAQNVEDKVRQRREEEAELERRGNEVKKRLQQTKSRIKKAKAGIKASEQAILDAEEMRNSTKAEWKRRLAEASHIMSLIELSREEDGASDLKKKYSDLVASLQEIETDLANRLGKQQKKRDALMQKLEALGGSTMSEIKKTRKACKALKKDIREAEYELEVLSKELERAPRGVNREESMQAILDMSANERKQQEQIDDVFQGIAQTNFRIQKVSTEVDTLFQGIEQEIYNVAKSDAFARDVFAKLVGIRAAYTNIVKAVESRGAVKNEVHQIESRNAKLLRNLAGVDLDAVKNDLKMAEEQLTSLKEAVAEAEARQQANDEGDNDDG